MKIKMTTSMAGRDFAYQYGQEVDLPQEEAIKVIEAGCAVPVRSAKPEKAVPRTKSERASK